MFITFIAIDIIAIIITIIAQCMVSSSFAKYREIDCERAVSGAEVARKILRDNDINEISVNQIGGELTDHYYHRKKELNLSSDIYSGTSVASMAVAAHESGHALQYKSGYFPIKIRNLIIPITNFANKMFIPLLIIGLILSLIADSGLLGEYFIYGSLALLGLSVLVNLVTLPVEFDASRRAMKELRENFDMTEEELVGARKMLTVAALTYVAGLAVSLLYLLRFVLIVIQLRGDGD